jgi:hypothetical protein
LTKQDDSKDRPPDFDEFELSIFGPGRGECILVHLGCGDWLCVDSCLDRSTGHPVALDYFQRIGLDVAQALRMILVTHWHQDHMRGASQVLRAAPNARFACSGALASREFFTAIAAAEGPSGERHPLREFATALQILEERRPRSMSRDSVSPLLADEGQLLLRLSHERSETLATVHAISPSPGARLRSFRELADFLPQAGTTRRRAGRLGANMRSVALWVEAGRQVALLGGDLENSPDHGIGWSAALSCERNPEGKAEVFKVAHHGSSNADHPEIWTKKLVTQPIAVLAPFASASKPIPSDRDQERIASQSIAYCTANPGGTKARASSRVVQRRLDSTPRRVRQVTGRMGHVRLRGGLQDSGPLSVELFSGAFQMVRQGT